VFKCPVSTPTIACSKCRFEEDGKNVIFHCHCGSPKVILNQRRLRPAHDHWNSARCRQITKEISQNLPLTSFFSKRPADETSITCPAPKQQVREVNCVGLTDESWPRNSKYKIIDCIRLSPNFYHGAEPRDMICKRLFGVTTESNLNDKQRAQLKAEVRAKATWVIERDMGIECIRSIKCRRVVPEVKGVELVLCDEC
ncbi:hypothetical protein DFH28DRAFT_830693, partial [Melampsora americana]